jgi:hypothetical protein
MPEPKNNKARSSTDNADASSTTTPQDALTNSHDKSSNTSWSHDVNIVDIANDAPRPSTSINLNNNAHDAI